MSTKTTKTTEAADAATEATEATAEATTTTAKPKTSSLCQVKVKSLQVGKTLLGRGATFRLADADATKMEKLGKVTILC